MMKKLYMVIVTIMLLIPAVSIAQPIESASYGEESPEYCQFSLSSYGGTISMGATSNFTVGLSCPQKTDVRATVTVSIDNERVASKVVVIPAGKDQSSPVNVVVGSEYNGKAYRMRVL